MKIKEVSVNSPVGIPIWQLKLLIPFGAGLLALQGFAETLRCIQCIRDNRWAPRLHDVEELGDMLAKEASSVSVVRHYAAAMTPGFLLARLYVMYVITCVIVNPSLAPKLPKEQSDVPWSEAILLMMKAFVPLPVLILAVLGAILGGLATPTEAAAVGAMVCFLFVASWTFSSVSMSIRSSSAS